MKVIATMSLPQLLMVALAAMAHVSAITQTLQAALSCIKLQALSAAVAAGFKGIEVPVAAATKDVPNYSARFVGQHDSKGEAWTKKFRIDKKADSKGATTEFQFTEWGECPTVAHDATKVFNCAMEVFTESADKFFKVHKAFSYADLEEIFKQTGEKATTRWCKD